ncbi:MAG TPA: ABC transporter permease, partial [Candidatus Krumholzibacterium sp.]|nr:ABC transporter permease [Candidatus Krumholzibacterium sp.]
NRGDEHTAFVPAPLLPALKEEFPEIEKAARVLPPGRMVVKVDEEVFYESGILFADAEFLDIFSFRLLAGRAGDQLVEANTALITPELSSKFFGEENPIGRFIGLGGEVNVRITGVIEQPSHYSSIAFRMLVSIDTADRIYGDIDDWEASRYAAFVLLPEGDDGKALSEALPAFSRRHIAAGPDAPLDMYLFPFLDFHLGAYEKIESFLGHENPIAVCIYFGTGIMVLLVVCINFMNLSTARYMRRAREVGVRKAIGAGRGQLVAQFLGESVVLAVLALPLGVALYYLMFNTLLAYLGADIEVPLWNHPYMIRYLLAVTLSTGLLAGTYPAFFLTKFSPVQVLKGRLKTGRRGPVVRRTLVISQFAMAVVLIVFAVISKRQFDFILEKVEFGYDRERVVTLPIPDGASLEAVKDELLRIPAITSVAASAGIPTDWDAMLKVVPEGAEDTEVMTMFSYGADHDLLTLLGIGRASGRFLSAGFPDEDAVVINETAARELGWAQPVGMQLRAGD